MKGYPYNYINITLKEDVTLEQRENILTKVFSLAGIRTIKIVAPPVTQENAPGGMLEAEIEASHDTNDVMGDVMQVEGVTQVDIRPLRGATMRPKAPSPAL
jgi:hypothetical protein